MFGIRHIAPTVLLKYLPCILRSTPHDLQLIVRQHHAWPFLENESMLREAPGCSRSIAKQCPSGVFIILWKHKHITIHQRSQFSLIFRIQHILFFENTSQNKPSPMLLLVPQGTSIRSAKPRFGPRIGFRKSNFVASQDHVEKLGRELQTHMARVSEMQVGWVSAALWASILKAMRYNKMKRGQSM